VVIAPSLFHAVKILDHEGCRDVRPWVDRFVGVPRAIAQLLCVLALTAALRMISELPYNAKRPTRPRCCVRHTEPRRRSFFCTNFDDHPLERAWNGAIGEHRRNYFGSSTGSAKAALSNARNGPLHFGVSPPRESGTWHPAAELSVGSRLRRRLATSTSTSTSYLEDDGRGETTIPTAKKPELPPSFNSTERRPLPPIKYDVEAATGITLQVNNTGTLPPKFFPSPAFFFALGGWDCTVRSRGRLRKRHAFSPSPAET